MSKVKKIHKIIFLFVLIFIIGVYSFSLYINNTIDKKKETTLESETHNILKQDKKAIQLQ
ncbi:hypothetical protein AWE51_07840 [Aquimarina aggregata]|uniref:Uncharacterized protein n=1 Tax=Aquimarina aggregata TaxID=1642818 RepID=A0A162Z4T7_9FLAO|nr:hypothetical protein AWE51_07840 [Aquimarina aggregata]